MGPGEQIDWHFVATGALGVVVTLLSWWGKTIYSDVKGKLSREEFVRYLDETTRSRTELRDNIVKLFEKSEAHEKLDAARFEVLTKDFNGGLSSLRELLLNSKLEIFDRINAKVDKS